MGEDTLSVGGIINIALGGLVYLINEEDEAEEYKEIWDQGTLNTANSSPKVTRSHRGKRIW